MKVIGAGFGRTGTRSLKLALEQIGFGKCYHMEELMRNPKDVHHWIKAYNNESPNWQELFADYRSAVDFPTAIYYKELANAFPKAKVILTVRDPESWYESVKRTIFSFEPSTGSKLKLLATMPFASKSRNFFKVIQHNNNVIWKKLFNDNFEDKKAAISVYTSHIEEVKNTIPSSRLLIYNVQQGWEPLCYFLNANIPETEFPNTNKRNQFHSWAKGLVQDVVCL